MAIDFVQLPPDSTGKKVASRSFTENSNTVYAQAGYITNDTAGGNPAGVINVEPGPYDWGLIVREPNAAALMNEIIIELRKHTVMLSLLLTQFNVVVDSTDITGVF